MIFWTAVNSVVSVTMMTPWRRVSSAINVSPDRWIHHQAHTKEPSREQWNTATPMQKTTASPHFDFCSSPYLRIWDALNQLVWTIITCWSLSASACQSNPLKVGREEKKRKAAVNTQAGGGRFEKRKHSAVKVKKWFWLPENHNNPG